MATTLTTHAFQTFNFKQPTWCDVCSKFIWGLYKQGKRCKVCHVNAHSACVKACTIECNASRADRHPSPRGSRSSCVAGTTILVTLVGGRDLVSCDLNGLSDPYCVVSLGATKNKTNPQNKTLYPRWNEKFLFVIPPENQKLSVVVWDKDKLSSDDFMGEVSIDLSVLDRDPVYEGWHTLTGKSGGIGDGVNGDIHIIVDSRPGAEERYKEEPKTPVRYKAGEVKRNNAAVLMELCDNFTVRFWKTGKEDKPLDDFEMISVTKIEKHDTNENCFKMHTTLGKGRVYDIEADTPALAADWMLALDGMRVFSGLSSVLFPEGIRHDLLESVYKTDFKGGMIKASYEEEWSYNPKNGNLKAEMGVGDDTTKIVYLWDGEVLCPADDSADFGVGGWDGVNITWYPKMKRGLRRATVMGIGIGTANLVPDANTFLFVPDVREYRLQAQEGDVATDTGEPLPCWKWTRHFLANKNGPGEWIMEGEVPEPVVMFLQLLHESIAKHTAPTPEGENDDEE
eukprot:TRINITY_DN2532_c0_g3_i1.p1 TRINITY_DN2532_c0_g3~~TRINITY_DN2532_c0_g3_i1.p1  ORF type:complete len:511 (-),score=135.90 TRINITY_DN2532_c0_g3_i1:75-1607(-)